MPRSSLNFRKFPIPRFPQPPRDLDPPTASWAAQMVATLEAAFSELAQYIQEENTQSPSALSAGNNNDFDPGRNAKTLRLSANASGSTVTGYANGIEGRKLRVVNVSSNTLTIAHEDTNSSATNRVICIGATDVGLLENEYAEFEYDATTSRWRMTFTNASAGTLNPRVSYADQTADPVDDGTDITYSLTWATRDNTPTADYNLTIRLFEDGAQIHEITAVSTAAGQPYSAVATGDGGGAGTRYGFARIVMVRVSDGAELQYADTPARVIA